MDNELNKEIQLEVDTSVTGRAASLPETLVITMDAATDGDSATTLVQGTDFTYTGGKITFSKNTAVTGNLTIKDATIGEVTATITKPVAGKTPADATVTAPESTVAESKTVWTDKDGSPVKSLATFAAGGTYTATITLIPVAGSGYKFDAAKAPTVTLDEQEIATTEEDLTKGKFEVANDGSKLTITKEFTVEKAAATAITNVEVADLAPVSAG